MTLHEALAFQREICVRAPEDGDADCEHRWREADERVRALEPAVQLNAEPQPLTAAAQALANQVIATPIFQTTFGSGPHLLASVRLDALVSAQRYVDVGHLGALQPPDEADEAAVLDFCMRANPIDPPLIGPDGGVAFSSHYSQNLIPSGLSYRAVSDHEIEVVATIRSRPNFVQVANVNGRFVIANGYHRAAALIMAGHKRMPCLLRTAPNLDQLGLLPPGFFDLARVMAARPPMTRDFIDNATDFQIRARNHVLRVGFQVQGFEAPR